MNRNAEIVKKVFKDSEVRFAPSGWFCATDAARIFGYDLSNWLKYSTNREIIIWAAKSINSNSVESTELEFEDAKNTLIRSSRGRYGSTWMHPKLAVPFAMALDSVFGCWVITQIEHVLLGEKDQVDWNAARLATKESNKVRNAVVKQVFEPTTKLPYILQSKEIWYVVTGKFLKVNREALSEPELRILKDIEYHQAHLLELIEDIGTEERRNLLIRRVNRLRSELDLPNISHDTLSKRLQLVSNA